MRIKVVAVVFSAFVLVGCETLGESALYGAGAGAITAVALGGDPVTGAVIGGIGGAYCYETNAIC